MEGARFASLAALTEHALHERPESRAAWLGIQAEAARLDAAEAANWPTLTGQFGFTRSRSLSSSGTTAPTLHRYGPSLSLAYVLYDFGTRAASIDAQRYQLVVSLLNNNRVLQDVIAEVEAAYYALLGAQAQVEALTQLEIASRASLDAAEARLQGGLVSRADQLRARAALAEAQLARQTAERDQAKAEFGLSLAQPTLTGDKGGHDLGCPKTARLGISRAGQPVLPQDVRHRPGTGFGKGLQARLHNGEGDGIRPDGIQPVGVSQPLLQAGHLLEVKGQGPPLLLDRPLPTGTLAIRLEVPLEEMGEQHGQAIDQFTLFTLAHVFDLLGQMFDVQRGELAGT